MIYILIALFCEAKPYIEFFQLKRVDAPGSLQVFEGDSCRLVVGGVGPVNAATASSYLLTRYAAGQTDFFINIGAAGSKVFNIGEIILCHKIINNFTKKEFYPEMLYKHPFYEGVLCSTGLPALESQYDLTDMEGAFAYEAAQIFLTSSQIHCIKVISDNLSPGFVTAEGLARLMYDTAEAICGWLGALSEPDKPADILTSQENSLLEVISEHLRLTFAMNQKMRQLSRQAKIRGMDIFQAFSDVSNSRPINKNESKSAFAKLVSRLLEE